MMKFGYLLAGQFLEGEDPHAQLEQALEQVRTAREAGFTSIWVTQHFLADFQFLQPIPLLSRVAAEAEGMSLGTAVLLAPMYPPVLLAEELATLDVLCGGRLIVGAGAGYREEEFAALGVPRKERAVRLAETVDLLRRLWSGKPVTYSGNGVELNEARARLLPANREATPFWIGATGPKGVAQAARIGDEWLVSPELPIGTIAERQQWYRDALPEGVRAEDKLFPILREAYCGASYDDAVRIARSALETKYAAYARWGHEVGSFDDMARDSFVLGDVDRCAEQVERYRTEVGTSFLGLRMQWPGLAQEDVLASIRSFGSVIARFSR
jgi:alkanesulfonate monooxygenase SsuD/methylene tetrahydromethanopterin reductase-like flavin-dependent oxidoreductase (luciferase family)